MVIIKGISRKFLSFILVVIILLGSICGVYYYRVHLPKLQYLDGLLQDINTKLDAGDLFGALDIFFNNEDLESLGIYLDVKLGIQADLYVRLKESLVESIDVGDFSKAKSVLDSAYNYLEYSDITELEALYSKAIYKDTIYRVASMLYSLNLSKELVVALTDIVYTNWDSKDKLGSKSSEVQDLHSKKDYAYSLLNSLGLELGSESVDSNSKGTSVEINEMQDTNNIIKEQVALKDVTVGSGILGDDLESLILDLFNIYNNLYVELVASTNNKLNYKKDIQVYSVKFDTTLDQILIKNKDIKKAYVNLVEKTSDLYNLSNVVLEEDNE